MLAFHGGWCVPGVTMAEACTRGYHGGYSTPYYASRTPWWPYYPWYTGHSTYPGVHLAPAVPGAVRASSPAPAEVPDDEVLGSVKEECPGWRPLSVLKLAKV